MRFTKLTEAEQAEVLELAKDCFDPELLMEDDLPWLHATKKRWEEEQRQWQETPPRMSAAKNWTKAWNLRATGLTRGAGGAGDSAALKFLSGCYSAELKHNSATSKTISGKRNFAVPAGAKFARYADLPLLLQKAAASSRRKI